MKRKNLKSLSHNFSHSFVSMENYAGDVPVFALLKRKVKNTEDRSLSVYWIGGTNDHLELEDGILQSIDRYKKWLPEMAENLDLSLDIIAELRTDIYFEKNHQLAVRAYVKDDNGKEHFKNIYDFADYDPHKDMN